MKGSNGTPVVVAIFVVMLVIVPAVYVASLGPAVWLHENKYLAHRPMVVFYWPLELLAQESPTAGQLLGSYGNLFRKEPLAIN